MSSNYPPPEMQHAGGGYQSYHAQPHNLPPLTIPHGHQHSHGQPPMPEDPSLSSHAAAAALQGVAAEQAADARSQLAQPLNVISRVDKSNGWKYMLQVVQQPQRARMCGFGDKDRRPITPPPCVRLIVTDPKTGKEVDVNEIEHSHYIIVVDLWAEDGQREVNLVRHTTATPSISSTTPASYAQVESSVPAYTNILPSHSPSSYQPQSAIYQAPPPGPPGPPVYQMGPGGYPQANYSMPPNGYGPPQQFYPDQFQQALVPSQSPMAGYAGRVNFAEGGTMGRFAMTSSQPQGMFTRNLIGSVVGSASRLTDPANHIGIWFILQDLSVRTEGSFRLKFSFVDVGPISADNPGSLNPQACPVLASCFSEVFTVFSAKKFPGVCESTELSKCFAGQGIKIPIRKEGGGKGGDDDDY